jgi:hypothetical protein
MVKPGGIGIPKRLISWRLAPLPPRMSLKEASPSVLSALKRYTHFLSFMIHLPTKRAER